MDCPICLEPVESNACSLECSHSFHAQCLVNWLRRGNLSCPSCRTDLEDRTQQSLGFMNTRARAAYMRHVARRKNAPPELKRMVLSIQKTKEKVRVAKQEMRAFEMENRSVLQRQSQMRTAVSAGTTLL